MKIENETRLHDVEAFVLEQLEAFDTRILDRLRLSFTRTRLTSGCCTMPKRLRKGSRKFVHGYRITASVHPTESRYPRTSSEEIGTEPTGYRPRDWRYVYEEIEFADAREALVFVAGHEVFHFLRDSRQVPGRNSEPGANRYGLAWLVAWRKREPGR